MVSFEMSCTYYVTKIASKITRYSQYANKFALATPIMSILPLPEIFLKLPRNRRPIETNKLKVLCDNYYKNPALDTPTMANARLHAVYLINIDETRITELDPDTYQGLVDDLNSSSGFRV